MPGSKFEAESKPGVAIDTMAGAKEEQRVFDRKPHAGGGNMDTTRVYAWSEASAIRDTFVRMVIKQTADQSSWFSAYRIQKVSFANKGIMVLDREKLNAMQFDTYDQVIEFMEKLFRAMGYEVLRRETFKLIPTLSPEQLLVDAEYMVSLLLSEYEWENSMKCFQSGTTEFGPAKYKIVDDALFTPQAQVKKREFSKSKMDEAVGGKSLVMLKTVCVRKHSQCRRSWISMRHQVWKRHHFAIPSWMMIQSMKRPS